MIEVMKHLFTQLCLLLPVVIFVAGCATVESRYIDAESADTIEAYEEFLDQYSEGDFANKARLRLEEIYFKKTQATNTIGAYEEFLNRYPEGQFAEEAGSKLEELHLKKAEASNTIEAYEEFLSQYVEGQFAEKAGSKLEELYFEKAEASNTIETYEEFLSQYPKGQFAEKAGSKLEELYFEKAEASNTIEVYEEFLSQYPAGKFADETRSRLKVLRAKSIDIIAIVHNLYYPDDDAQREKVLKEVITPYLKRYVEQSLLPQLVAQGFNAEYLGVQEQSPIQTEKGVIIIDYDEEEGGCYGFTSFDCTFHGVNITVKQQLIHPVAGETDWQRQVKAGNSSEVSGGFHEDTLKNLESELERIRFNVSLNEWMQMYNDE